MVRLKAILNCLYFGLLPWWMYEKKRHYECSYAYHLVINIQYAWRWATFQEDDSDRHFEATTNNNGVICANENNSLHLCKNK